MRWEALDGRLQRWIQHASALLAALQLAACASAPVEPPPLPEPVAPPPPVRSSGSLYEPGNSLSLFADTRARQVGDVLTVVLEERTSARKSATTSTSKNQSVGFDVPSLFGASIPEGRLNAELSGDRSFEGSGDSAQSNQLNGELTVRVIERLPGNTLRIAGEKRLRLNQGLETLRLQGLVRVEDIGPDNTVPSHRIANADISYSGRGAVADANAQGWLARFFNSPLWPF